MQPMGSEVIFVHQLDQLIDFTELHHVNPHRYPFILESSAQAEDVLAENSKHSGKAHARYDILFAFPLQTLTLDSENKLTGAVQDENKDFLSNLDLNWQQTKSSLSIQQQKWPFSGGWFVYLGYELASQIEPRLKLPHCSKKSIVAKLTRIPVAIIYDKYRGVQSIVAEEGYEDNIQHVLDDIQAIQNKQLTESAIHLSLKEDTPEKYLDAIAKVKHYIKEGDVFQVNLSRLWVNNNIVDLNPLALYRSLKKTNPAPFSAYVYDDELIVISSSPERLVKVSEQRIQTRPIAGTRARNNETFADIESLRELIAHPKERAEHIMLIDLERNDLGRICVPGSIHVDELMVLESFQHVHHIVSNVAGELRDDITPGDIISAVFPGGTITGCPKERCMQIIAELEAVPRGAYTGSVGYINHDGSLDLNILIRTFELSDSSLKLRAGAGLVADSIAEKELDETCTKAKGLLEALT